MYMIVMMLTFTLNMLNEEMEMKIPDMINGGMIGVSMNWFIEWSWFS